MKRLAESLLNNLAPFTVAASRSSTPSKTTAGFPFAPSTWKAGCLSASAWLTLLPNGVRSAQALTLLAAWVMPEPSSHSRKPSNGYSPLSKTAASTGEVAAEPPLASVTWTVIM